MEEQNKMSFLQHLEELRWRLVRSAAVILAFDEVTVPTISAAILITLTYRPPAIAQIRASIRRPTARCEQFRLTANSPQRRAVDQKV